MKREDLLLLDVQQLRNIYDNIELPYHHKSGKEKLIEGLLSVTVNPVEIPRAGAAPHLEEIASHSATQELKPIKRVTGTEYPTADQVREELAPYVQRGLEVVSLDEEGFHFRKGNKEDSGTLKQPIRRIIEVAARLV